jgi:hypothetical protein
MRCRAASILFLFLLRVRRGEERIETSAVLGA